MASNTSVIQPSYGDYDISGGIEKYPVSVDSEEVIQKVAQFVYVACNIPGPDTSTESFEEQFSGCSCVSCDLDCPCLDRFGPAYDSKGYLIHTKTESLQIKPIYECNRECSCDKRCTNRVVQFGLSVPVKIFIDPLKDFGVRAVGPIHANSFVCEYAGEILTDQVAKQRCQNKELNHFYILTVREHLFGGEILVTYIDPTYIGNVGRFINHSCEPNLFLVPVRVNNSVPKLALFSRRNIEPNEELTFDYGDGASGFDSVISDDIGIANIAKRKLCYCNSKNCRRVIPFDESILSTK